MDIELLNAVIVRAKAATYVGGGTPATPSRLGSRDLTWSDGHWSYRDSYFGGTDFIGQETIWLRDEPVWAMNYFGYISHPELIDAQRAGATIKAALSSMYAEQSRFLGGYEWHGNHGHYLDRNEGEAARFRGREVIVVEGTEAYVLDYHGGLIKP
jgi:hypothetical protein